MEKLYYYQVLTGLTDVSIIAFSLFAAIFILMIIVNFLIETKDPERLAQLNKNISLGLKGAISMGISIVLWSVFAPNDRLIGQITGVKMVQRAWATGDTTWHPAAVQ